MGLDSKAAKVASRCAISALRPLKEGGRIWQWASITKLKIVRMSVVTKDWPRVEVMSIAPGVETRFEVVYPGVLITVTVLGFNMLGDRLRDVLDTRYSN